MHTHALTFRRRRSQRGLSLIEIMIALVIGMAAVIVMMQMLLNSDTSKRITTGGNDAQITGTIALYNLERDIKSSGYGLNSPSLLGCTLIYSVAGANVRIPLAPTTINPPTTVMPAGDDQTDTLLVVYGTSRESADGDPLIALSTTDSYQVTTAEAFRPNDMVAVQLATRPTTSCTVQLSRVTAVNKPTLTVENGVEARPAGSIAFNLGQLVVRAYAVRKSVLTMCDYRVNNCADDGKKNDSDIWVPVANNIVAMRAQYGRDTTDTTKPRTGVVQVYDQTTPPESEKLHCAWARVVAVRVGLVARGTAFDKTIVDKSKPAPAPPPPTWSGDSDSDKTVKNAKLAPFDLSKTLSGSGANDWKAFRYKTFETTIPLRNTIWQGDLEC